MSNGQQNIWERHEQTLYRGNGKPGLCTRMQQAEDRLDSGDDRMSAQDARIDNFVKMGWAIILLLVSCLAGIITEIIKK